MKIATKDLIKGIQRRDFKSIARAITLVENFAPQAGALQKALYKNTGRAHIVGVTGSPGAGKSTLVDELAREFKKCGKRVAILAVDPSSPFSGGAILGDRIRMMRSEEAGEIFIRSMATRGALGGVSNATFGAAEVLDAAGFDIILIETVGVGQGEVDIVKAAHTCLVVMVPGMGDSVQSIKAGILEIADLFVINKADREGADTLHKDLRIMLSLVDYAHEGWKPEILRTVATEGIGIEDLVQEIESHKKWLDTSSGGRERQLALLENTIERLAAHEFYLKLGTQRDLIRKLAVSCYHKKVDPFTASKRIKS